MLVQGLSTDEYEKLVLVLQEANIPFETKVNEPIKLSDDPNEKPLEYHQTTRVSTHILALEFDDRYFEQMNTDIRLKLLNFGISSEVPEGFFEDEQSSEAILKPKKKKMIEKLQPLKRPFFIIVTCLYFYYLIQNNFGVK